MNLPKTKQQGAFVLMDNLAAAACHNQLCAHHIRAVKDVVPNVTPITQ